jgi:hypothetical protein
VAVGVKDTPLVTPPVHVYVDAPVPASVTAVPEHTVWSTPAFTIGRGLTVTVTDAVFVHPEVVPVTVYVVVVPGDAVTVAPVDGERPVVGDHVYVVAPEAVNVVEAPAHMAVLGLTVTVGGGRTVTVTWSVVTQPAVVPVTV